MREELRQTVSPSGGAKRIYPGAGEVDWPQKRSASCCPGKGVESHPDLGRCIPIAARPHRCGSGLFGTKEQGNRISSCRSRVDGTDLHSSEGNSILLNWF